MIRIAIVHFALLFILATPAGAAEEDYTLAIGGQQLLPAQDINKYAVSDKKIIQVAQTSDGAQLAVRGISAGFATLTVYLPNNSSRIHSFLVTSQNVKTLERKIKHQLEPFPNVKAEASGGQVALQGFVSTNEQLQAIRELVRSYGPAVVSTVTKGAAGMQPTKMIRMEVIWVQSRQRAGNRIGLRWPSSFGAGGSQVSLQGDFALGANMLKTAPFSLVSDLFPVLDLNTLTGSAKVIRSHTLITENGVKSNSSNGSEIYVRLVSGLGNSKLERIFFGADLAITPTLAPSGDVVTLDVAINVSERDSNGSQDGIPVRLVDKLETTVHVPLGQSMMLSGVKLKAWSQSQSGLPGVCRVPVLNFFFCSRAKELEDAEGLLFITPTVIQASSPENKQRIAEALQKVEQMN